MTPDKIQTYYTESFQFLQLRKKRQAAQLVLLSNLRRGDANISSTLMLTLFDRIMSNLYDDKIQVKFLPSQGLSQEQINAYNMLYQSDYQEMNKAKLDYDWCWDALFFGRGYMETVRFDMKKKIMQPHVINPLNFGYDPYSENVQDWRYYWKWLTKSKNELKRLKAGGALKQDFDIDRIAPGVDPYLWEYKVTRDQAREGVAPPMEPFGSDLYQIFEFYGHNEDGEKCVYWTDKNFSTVIYEKKLDFGDGDEIIMPDGKSVETDSKWPIVVKEAFRVPHSSIPLSVADLLEDKHRAKSVLLNLAFIAAKDEANPVYWFNDQVEDASAFLSRQLNQHIKVTGDGNTAVGPINKASVMNPELITFMQILDSEAEEPIGAGKPMSTAGGSTKQTATQAALDQQLNDMAQSLQSKVMQFGEADFCSAWFHRYAKNAEALKEKTANIIGIKGVDSTIINLEMFKADFPPGVMVYSAKEAEYKNLVKRRDLMQLYPALAQTLDPDGMRNFQKHVFFPLMIEDPATIDVMFPKTLDEIKAEGENEQLAQGTMPPVAETDDHTTHIYMHRMLNPKTHETWFHLDWHEKLLAEQKKQEMDAQKAAIQDSMSAIQSGKPKVGAEKSNPLSAASPLKTETVNSLNANK
jgi:hypothetical protein